jgi:molybdenum cofactor biosynthesis protein B
MTVITAPGGRIDEGRTKTQVRIAVLTVSDTRDEESDTSGDLLASRVKDAGHELIARGIVKDDVDEIRRQVLAWVADGAEAIVSTGGTGITGRDVTPEAFSAVYEKEIPGFGELFRFLSYRTIGTSTIQSRATAGVAGGTYLFALPGSPGACRDAWDQILVTQLDARFKPCNFVELLPRLKER